MKVTVGRKVKLKLFTGADPIRVKKVAVGRVNLKLFPGAIQSEVKKLMFDGLLPGLP